VFLHMAKDIEIKKQQKNMEAMDKFWECYEFIVFTNKEINQLLCNFIDFFAHDYKATETTS
jgi:hypothetical protein